MTQIKEGVYLIHFSEPYKGASHYIGWSTDIDARFITHSNGQGSPLIKAVLEAGYTIHLARIWLDKNRHFERSLKNRKNAKKLCPICKGTKQLKPCE